MKITDAVINIVYRVTLVYFYWLMATTVISQAALAQVTDISISKKANLLLFPTKPESVKILQTEAITLTQAIEIAVRNNLDLQIAILELERSRSALRQVQADLFPNLNVNSNVTRSESASNQLAAQPSQGRLGDNPATSFSADLQFIYKLYTSGNRNAKIQGATQAGAAQEKTNITIAEANFARASDQIRFDVEQQYSQLQSNLTNIQTTNLALEQAKEALRLARLRFQAGVGTQTDVIAAENDLTRADSDKVTAILNYNRAFARLQRAATRRTVSTHKP